MASIKNTPTVRGSNIHSVLAVYGRGPQQIHDEKAATFENELKDGVASWFQMEVAPPGDELTLRCVGLPTAEEAVEELHIVTGRFLQMTCRSYAFMLRAQNHPDPRMDLAFYSASVMKQLRTLALDPCDQKLISIGSSGMEVSLGLTGYLAWYTVKSLHPIFTQAVSGDELLKQFFTDTASIANRAQRTAVFRKARDVSDAQIEKEGVGDMSLINGKESVPLRIAERFLGITARQRQRLMHESGPLRSFGTRYNKRITAESILEYFQKRPR